MSMKIEKILRDRIQELENKLATYNPFLHAQEKREQCLFLCNHTNTMIEQLKEMLKDLEDTK